MKHSIQRRAGVECGASGAKLVTLSFRESGVVVDEVGVEDESFAIRHGVGGRPPRSAFDQARQLLMHRDLRRSGAVLVAEGASGCCFALLPRMPGPDLVGALRLQATKALAWTSKDPVMVHVDSDFARERIGSIVGLGDWSAIKDWCRLVEGVGAEVEDATVRVSAYQSLARRQGWADESPVCLVADIGAAASLFCVLEDGEPRFLREAPVGGDAVTKALMTEVSTENGVLRFSAPEADENKLIWSVSGAPDSSSPHRHARQMEMMARPVVERIGSEVTRSIQFYKENTGHAVSAVFLTGGTGGLAFLENHLRASLTIPVRRVDPFAGMSFADSGVEMLAHRHGGRLTVAVGLALVKDPSLSLLPRPARISRRLSRFATAAVMAILAAGFIPFVVMGTVHWVRQRTTAFRVERLRDELGPMAGHQQSILALQGDIREAMGRYQLLKTVFGRGPQWAGVLNALAASVPPEAALTRVATLRDGEGKISLLISGEVTGSRTGLDTSLAALVSALSSSVAFSRVSVVSAEVKPGDGIVGGFEIRCDLAY